jgi:hypothetical protein
MAERRAAKNRAYGELCRIAERTLPTSAFLLSAARTGGAFSPGTTVSRGLWAAEARPAETSDRADDNAWLALGKSSQMATAPLAGEDDAEAFCLERMPQRLVRVGREATSLDPRPHLVDDPVVANSGSYSPSGVATVHPR